MAAFDVERRDPLDYFRTEMRPADFARSQAEFAAQRQQEANSATILTILLAILLLVLALAVVLHRRKIAQTLDAALISGLATGVRTARKAQSKRAAWVSRIMAKADEKIEQ